MGVHLVVYNALGNKAREFGCLQHESALGCMRVLRCMSALRTFGSCMKVH